MAAVYRMNLGVQQGAQTGEHCIATVCVREKEDLNCDGCEDDERRSESEWRGQHMRVGGVRTQR